MTKENWRPVLGAEGVYSVSDVGNVRSEDRDVYKISKLGATFRQRTKGRMLRPWQHRDGHLQVEINYPTGSKRRFIHHLVLESFVGIRSGDQVVRHLNGNPADNRLANIVYGTFEENNRDTVRHGRHRFANQTHCVRGHELAGDNVLRRKDRPGARECRTCRRDAKQRWEAARKP